MAFKPPFPAKKSGDKNSMKPAKPGVGKKPPMKAGMPPAKGKPAFPMY